MPPILAIASPAARFRSAASRSVRRTARVLARVVRAIPVLNRVARMARNAIRSLTSANRYTRDVHSDLFTQIAHARGNVIGGLTYVHHDLALRTIETRDAVVATVAALTDRHDEHDRFLRGELAKLHHALGEDFRHVQSQIRALHDHHAEAYQTLAVQLRDGTQHWQLTFDGLQDRVDVLAQEVHGNSDWLKLMSNEVRGNSNWLQSVANEVRGHGEWLQSVSNEVRGNSNWLQSVANEVRGHSVWVSILQRKHEMMALDLRERVPTQPEPEFLPEPQVLDQEALDNKVRDAGGLVRLNLGCGETPLPGYVNVDMRPMPGIEVVADIRRLPFEPGTVDEIASAHLVEHFRQHHLTQHILPYWLKTLKPGGTLRIVCPNWQAMIERLNSGTMPYEVFHRVTFGGQDYSGDDHFAMYTPDSLMALLTEIGFREPRVVAYDRQNGMCPEMEIVAVR